MKTREEVAKLATAVANVPVDPGALVFLYTLQVASVQLYRRAVNTIHRSAPLVLSVYSKVEHESYCH